MSDDDTDAAAPAGTATLEQARAHARAQAGGTVRSGPTLPASAARDLPDGVHAGAVLWDETVAVGGYAARRLPRGAVLRIDDGGDACVQLLVHNAHNTAERLNVADTVKVQWQAYLGLGSILLSDMGRALMTIVDDDRAQHDCLCGGSNRRVNQARYGDGSVAGPFPNARDLLALAGLKHGLTRLDIGPCINLFTRVRVEHDGSLRLADDRDGASGTTHHVHLRADLDVILLVANTPHVLDDDPVYAGSTIRLTAWRAEPPAGPEAGTTTPERARAYVNTGDHLSEVSP